LFKFIDLKDSLWLYAYKVCNEWIQIMWVPYEY